MAGKSELHGTKRKWGTATWSSALTSILVCKGTLTGLSVPFTVDPSKNR